MIRMVVGGTAGTRRLCRVGPECGFVDENRQIAALCGDLSEVRSKGKCDFCGERGQIVQCSRKRCAASFHPACILRELMGPREWSRRWDAGHPGAFVRHAGCRGECRGRHLWQALWGYGRQGPDSCGQVRLRAAARRAHRAEPGLPRFTRIGRRAVASKFSHETQAAPRADAAGARKSARECAQAVQPGQYAPPPQRRSEAEIEEEREERAAERLAKFLKGRTRPRAGRGLPPTPRIFEVCPVPRGAVPRSWPRRLCYMSGGRARAGVLRSIPRGGEAAEAARARRRAGATAGREGGRFATQGRGPGRASPTSAGPIAAIRARRC